MNKFKSKFSGWYWRALFLALTIGAMFAAFAAPNNWS